MASEQQRVLRSMKAETRKRRYWSVVAELKKVARDPLMTWAEAAQLLEKRGVVSHYSGEAFSKVGLMQFVRRHREVWGEQLLGWIGGQDHSGRGRKIGMKGQVARDELAERVVAACAEAKGYAEAAQMLNREGVKTRAGKAWTVTGVYYFERRFRESRGRYLFKGIARRNRRRR